MDRITLPFEQSDLARSIIQRFSQVAASEPDRTAIGSLRTAWSYSELDAKARSIAGELIDLSGDGSEPVALLMEHDAPLIAAIFGILYAGKFYCSLDPTMPAGRLAANLADLRPRFMITDRSNQSLAEAVVQPGTKILSYDQIGMEAYGRLPGIDLPPTAPAAIFFTTGTTGQPKGVIRNHGLVMHRAWVDSHDFITRLDDRRSLFTTTSFPASVSDIMGALLAGASVFLYSLKLRGAIGLGEWIRQNNITILRPPISFFRQFINLLPESEVFDSVRLVSLSGDVLYKSDVERAFPHFRPDVQIHHHYASSEAGIVAGCMLSGQTRLVSSIIPVGFPSEGKTVMLLDDNHNPVKEGQAGEIAVKSPFLGSSYWRQPELNEKKYIDNPANPGQKIFLTGDLGRINAEGMLEFLGRKDQMVKIRGYNVDLTGIEAVLRDTGLFKDLAVAARFDPGGERQVIAYLVADGTTVPVSEVRAKLAEILPDYMVPAAYVYLHALPITANGKLDRQALPAPPRLRPEGIGPYQPPRSLLENIVADIWAEVLQIDAVGVNDSFLDLGGQSLTGTQIVARVTDSLNVDLPQRTLFDAPTVADMVQAIESARKIELEPISPQRISGPQPMSFAQQRLWFLHKLAPEDSPYNETRLYQLSGPLDVLILESSFRAVIERQAAMRTHLLEVDGRPVQVVADDWEFRLPIIDLRNSPNAELRLAAEIDREAHHPFDLEHDLLIRVKLFRLSDDDARLVITKTISSDNWSSQLLFNEIAKVYNAILTQSEPRLPGLPVQYIDFAVWQRGQLQGEKYKGLLSYWREKLAGAPALEMPTDYPRPMQMTYAGATHVLILDNSFLQRLNGFNAREKTTRFMTLAAVFYVLLMRYSGQEDISLGIPVANRTRRELENLIGFFVNTLVMRLDMSGQPTFRTLLGRLREIALQAYDHQEMPFDLLVDELHPSRSLQLNPLFQVMFNYRRRASEVIELGDCRGSRLPFDSHLTKFDLSLEISESNEGLYCEFSYKTDLFAASTIERMAHHYTSLIDSAMNAPGESIHLLQYLSQEELNRLSEWNQTHAELPPVSNLAEMIDACIEKYPDRTALFAGDRKYTYHELDSMASRLAREISERSAQPDQIVAICLERTPAMLAAILGVLKSGSAYLPIDPNFPLERKKFILEDSQARLVVSDSNLAASLPTDPKRVILYFEDVMAKHSQIETKFTLPKTGPANLAYVLYTSGSTGAPKGVAIEHRSALAFMGWAQTYFSADELEGVLASTSYCFDLSVFELLFPLTVGGSVVLVENLFGLSQAPFADKVTLINTVPSLMVEYLGSNRLPRNARVVNLAGEALPAVLVEQIFQDLPGVKINNLYGPTEDTTYSTYAEILPGDPAPAIGRPISNTRAYILDRYMQPKPIGLPGELYLAGAGLARGYLNRPGLTEERFFDMTNAEGNTERVYKTGDLARFRLDGQLEYLGRVDQQVKLRGFRIELGEIESVLLQHPAVQQAAVILKESHPGEKQIAAFLSRRPRAPAGDRSEMHSELRSYLQEKLPDYMIPTAFVSLDAFPLTSTGKLDRLALAEYEIPSETGAEDQADLSPLEKVIAGILSDVLPVPCRRAEDDFFELGGHSLLAIRATGRIREILKVELPVRAFMGSPTVSGLATAVLAHSPNPDATKKRASMLVKLSEISEQEAQDQLDRIGERQS